MRQLHHPGSKCTKMKLLDQTLYWLLIIQVFVTIHFWIIERDNKNPSHLVSWLAISILAVFCSMVLFDTWYFRIVNVIYLALVYWILFPLQLNIFRKKDLLYMGDPENEDGSWLDSLERRMKNPSMIFGLKIVLTIICIYILLDL